MVRAGIALPADIGFPIVAHELAGRDDLAGNARERCAGHRDRVEFSRRRPLEFAELNLAAQRARLEISDDQVLVVDRPHFRVDRSVVEAGVIAAVRRSEKPMLDVVRVVPASGNDALVVDAEHTGSVRPGSRDVRNRRETGDGCRLGTNHGSQQQAANGRCLEQRITHVNLPPVMVRVVLDCR